MGEYVLEVNNITKVFPGVVANDNVSLNVKPGEILGLIGENGAGKSTLLKIINGIYPAGSYQGEIKIDGEVVRPASPVDAVKMGIGFVAQEVSVFRFESVPENIYMGDLTLGKKTIWVNQNKLRKAAQELIDELQLDIDIDLDTRKMSIGQQQMLMIAKALSSHPKILILDEPTTSLSNRDVENLFRVVRRLRDNGTGIIFVTHKMDEIMELTDRVAVLRDGKRVGEFEKAEYDRDKIIAAMIGREVTNMYPPRNVEIGEEVLRVENLCRKDRRQDVSFSLHQGEVLGIAGLVGAGRTEIMRAIFGVDYINAMDVYIRGKKVKIKTPAQAKKYGIAFLTEDRKLEGLTLDFTVKANIVAANLGSIKTGLFTDTKKENEIADAYIAKTRIKTPHRNQKVGNLSGGNQQKVVVSKWLNSAPDILIMDEPTRGIDVGAKREIYEIINDLVAQGKSVILISSELPEVLGMSDRVLVMKDDAIVAVLSGDDINAVEVMKYAL